MTFPLPARFFFEWIVLKQSLEEEGGGGGEGGSWSRIPAPLSRETRIPLFFHRFSEFLFCFQKQQQQQPKKISRICLIRTCRMISQIPNIQEKNPLSRLNFQNFGEICFLGRCKIPWRDRAITCEFCRDLHLTLMFSSLYKKIRLMESELWRNVISNKIIFTLGLQGLPSSFLSRPGAYVH